MDKDTVWVFPHLEMGDNIVLNGLARFLARSGRDIAWVARASYFKDIQAMYSDLSNLTVIDGYDYPEARLLIPGKTRPIVLGFMGTIGARWDAGPHWDETLYKESKVAFEERWRSFDLPPNFLPREKIPLTNRILVHENLDRGMTINPTLLPEYGCIVRITRRDSFWDWLPDIYSASELHFIDSSYLNLAESLYTLGYLRNCKLVFHRYVKQDKHNSVPPVLRAPWKIL